MHSFSLIHHSSRFLVVGLRLEIRSTAAWECSPLPEDVSQGLAARVGSTQLRPYLGPGASSEPSGSGSLPAEVAPPWVEDGTVVTVVGFGFVVQGCSCSNKTHQVGCQRREGCTPNWWWRTNGHWVAATSSGQSKEFVTSFLSYHVSCQCVV